MKWRLQPLRVPRGWKIEFNSFFEVDASQLKDSELVTWLGQNLLQIHHGKYDRLLDLGWYLNYDGTEGSFKLVMYAGDFRGELLHTFRHRERSVVVDELERLMQEISEGRVRSQYTSDLKP